VPASVRRIVRAVPASPAIDDTEIGVPIRLVIADDHPIVLAGLVEVFAVSPRFAIVGTVSDGNAALAAILEHQPDVAILDVRMRGLGGLGVARPLLPRESRTRIILLTAEIGDDEALEAIRLGVRGVILKHMATRLLVQCVEKVHAGGRWGGLLTGEVLAPQRRPVVAAILFEGATGEIVRRGERRGIPTPVNVAALRVLNEIGAGRRRPEPANFDDLAAAVP
jgi:CheY-like chemotaxis protein